MNELDLTIRGATLDEIHERGLERASAFFGDKRRPSLVRCHSRVVVEAPTGDAVAYEAEMTYRGVPVSVQVTSG